MHEQVGIGELFERRAECRDERGRQLVDESNRVGDEDVHAAVQRGEARQPVFELGQLDLDPTLTRARVPREDVQDHAGPIHHRRPNDLLQRTLLPRLELIVRDDEIRPQARDLAPDLAGLAFADPRVRIRSASELEHATDHAPAGRLHERRELVERIFGVESGTREIQSDEIRTLGRCRRVDQPTSPSNAYSAGPESSNVSGPARTTSSPPGTRTRTAASMRCSQAAAATVAHAPVPHAWVSPTPRSSTRKAIRPGSTTRATSTFTSPATPRMATATRDRSTIEGSSTKTTTCGFPTLTRYARRWPSMARDTGVVGARSVIAIPSPSRRALTQPPAKRRSSESPPLRSSR